MWSFKSRVPQPTFAKLAPGPLSDDSCIFMKLILHISIYVILESYTVLWNIRTFTGTEVLCDPAFGFLEANWLWPTNKKRKIGCAVKFSFSWWDKGSLAYHGARIFILSFRNLPSLARSKLPRKIYFSFQNTVKWFD